MGARSKSNAGPNSLRDTNGEPSSTGGCNNGDKKQRIVSHARDGIYAWMGNAPSPSYFCGR
jgi:hypothetical protein